MERQNINACQVACDDNEAIVGIGTVTVSWTPPTTNVDGSSLVDLAGYKIKYGTKKKRFPNIIDIENVGLTSYVIENLSPNIYYFVMTAYRSSGVESDHSNMVSIDLE